nr:Transposon gamma-delta resolvase [Pseudomonas syringae]
MTTTLIGYARCSTDKQDLSAQQSALIALGVASDRIYTDHGLTGTHRSRPGLDQALAAVRSGDTLVVPKLDRLARSVPDARHIADALIARGIKLALVQACTTQPIQWAKCFSTSWPLSLNSRPT